MSDAPKTLFGHPRGLYVLFFTEMWERFSFYGMKALLMLYMVNELVWVQKDASALFKWYSSLVYAMPLVGGLVADRFLGAKRTVVVGAILLSLGHFLMVFEPLPYFYSALALIILGVGFLKPNISTQVGSLYPPGDHRRDGAFTIFYMGINVGAALGMIICPWLQLKYGFHYGFGAAGVGMAIGLVVYVIGQAKLVEFNQDPVIAGADGGGDVQELLPKQVVRDRVIVLCVVFLFAVLFFMAFEQSANALVIWADKHTNLQPFAAEPPPVLLDASTAAEPSADQATGAAAWQVAPAQVQSLNSIFIIVLAPVFAGFWLWLDRRKREPSTPAKMAVGILLLGAGFLALYPAATAESRPSAAQLAELPPDVHLEKYGATRLHFDADAGELRMEGVLTDLDRWRLLAEGAEQAYKDRVAVIVKRSEDAEPKDFPMIVEFNVAPSTFHIHDEDAGKKMVWNPVGRVLTLQEKIGDREELILLSQGAVAEFRQAVDEIFVESNRYRVSIWWLVLHFLLITMGELCLSPVGLSLVTKMAPPKFVGLLMGAWFLATAAGEWMAHYFGELWGTMTPAKYFTIFAIVCLVGGFLLAIVVKPLKRMMHGIQ